MQPEQLLTSALLRRFPVDDNEKIRAKIKDPILGPHWFLRTTKQETRARFWQLMDHNQIPTAFLFGSPHLDNYAKTNTGCGMIDFDRAYHGPYAWDLLCFLLSISLRHEQAFALPNHNKVEPFFNGYVDGLALSDKPYTAFALLDELQPKKWQRSVEAYLSAEKKWAKKLKRFAIDPDEPLLNELKRQYFSNLAQPENPDDYQITAAGRSIGSLGRPHNLLVCQHKNGGTRFIDIKPTRDYLDPHWPHNHFYTSQYQHDGQRMIAASQLHAPGVTEAESWATVNGIQYWGRAVPLQNQKLKGILDQELKELCYAVGTQLGRSHGLSGDRQQIATHLTSSKTGLLQICETILEELHTGWQHYLTLLQGIQK